MHFKYLDVCLKSILLLIEYFRQLIAEIHNAAAQLSEGFMTIISVTSGFKSPVETVTGSINHLAVADEGEERF